MRPDPEARLTPTSAKNGAEFPRQSYKHFSIHVNTYLYLYRKGISAIPGNLRKIKIINGDRCNPHNQEGAR
jgi:hypothetical protein